MSINKDRGWNIINQFNVLINRWTDRSKADSECERINQLNKKLKTGSHCVVIENIKWSKGN